MALFPGPPGWAGARRELLDFTVQGKINRDRHIDHPAGRHSIRTNQCPIPPSSFFTDRMPFLPPNQQRQSTEGKTDDWLYSLKHGQVGLVFSLHSTDGATTILYIINIDSFSLTLCVNFCLFTHTHTQPLYDPFSGTTPVSQCQKRTSGLYGARED